MSGSIKFQRSPHFPRFRTPDDWRDFVDLAEDGETLSVAELEPAAKPGEFEFLYLLAEKGLRWRYGEKPPARARSRLVYELSVVESVGYAEYFLIVWDIGREARARGIPFLARGSAADSLLCYVLGISTVCPLWFNLYFERFLNKERMQFSKLADIDLDFPWDQREEMIDYVFERYGRDHVAMIGGFNRFHARAAIGDIGKVLGLSESEVRAFTRKLPIMSADAIMQGIGETASCRELPLEEEPYPEILEMAMRFEDIPRYLKLHPCGIVIGNTPLADLMPLLPSDRGPQMTQFDMDAVEDLGLVKIDLLGQAGLATLRDALRNVRETTGDEPDLERLDWNDTLTWDLISSGNARGIHHIESPAMTSLLVQTHCRDMNALCAVVSVIRPGAADEAKKLAYTRRHQGFEPAVYPHESLEPFLRDTYGLLVYEEHILMVAHHFAGMNLGRADVLRRHLVKAKDQEALAELGKEFYESAMSIGRSEEDARRVLETLFNFHGYMFNKAHSASYALQAFQGAWLKARYPAQYMAAMLSQHRGFYTPLFYALESLRLGLEFRGPCVNASRSDYLAEPNQIEDSRNLPSKGVSPLPKPSNGSSAGTLDLPAPQCSKPGKGETPLLRSDHPVIGDNPFRVIRVPLPVVKDISQATFERWQTARSQGEFTGLRDFLWRVRPRLAETERFIQAGALDCLGLSRSELFWRARFYAQKQPADDNLELDLGGDDPPELPENLQLTEPDTQTRARWETELWGFPVSRHPLEFFGDEVDWGSYCPARDAGKFPGQTVHICGLIVATRLNHTLKGQLMSFLTLADFSGFVETTLFPKIYRRYGHLGEMHKVTAITGTVEPFDNGHGFIIDVQKVEEARKGRRVT